MGASPPWSADRFVDPRLGEFHPTRQKVRALAQGRRDVWRNWQGSGAAPGQTHAVLLSLSGDERSPDSGLVEAVYAVLDGLPAILERALVVLRERGRSATIDDYRLAAISDWDRHDGVLLVELVKVGSREVEGDLELYWPGDDWALDHHIVLRGHPDAPVGR